jgi:hypothetical protein
MTTNTHCIRLHWDETIRDDGNCGNVHSDTFMSK